MTVVILLHDNTHDTRGPQAAAIPNYLSVTTSVTDGAIQWPLREAFEKVPAQHFSMGQFHPS